MSRELNRLTLRPGLERKALTVSGDAFYLLIKILCGCLFLLFGYDAGVLGGLLVYPPFRKAMGNPTGAWTIPMISSSYTLAACVTSPFVATFAFHIGRRGCMMIGCVVVIIGAILQASSYSVAQIIVGRLVTGFGIGNISSSVPSYLAETGIRYNSRGPAGAINGSLLIFGVPLAYWIDYGFTKYEGDARWRIPISLQEVFALAALVALFFFPDTPRWYYARGKQAEGDAVLCKLNGKPLDDPFVERTKKEIHHAIEIELEASKSVQWSQFLTFGIFDKSPQKIVRRLSMCFWITFLRQWAGINLIVYYLSIILTDTGISPSLVSLLSGVVTTWFWLGTVPLIFTIEKFGHRKIMLIGTIIETFAMLVFIVLIALPNPTASTQWGSFVVICIFVFTFGYSTAGMIWLYSVEIPPLEYRRIGASFSSFGEWLATFLTTSAGPIGIGNVGWKLYIWILIRDILFASFIYFLCPETTNLSLEQLDDVFGAGLAYRDEENSRQGSTQSDVDGNEKVVVAEVADS